MQINKRLFKELYYDKNDAELAILFETSERSIQRYAGKLRAKGELGYRKTAKSNHAKKAEFYDKQTGIINVLKETLSGAKPYDIKVSPKKVGDTLVVHITDW
ncbi:unnamed protein product, partial [marine sediment metagenome]